jgi:hypothetical protein
MNASNTGLKGYSLPLSPTGISSLIDGPDWHFGGELAEVIYKTDPETFAALLPKSFRLIPNKPVVSIAIVDMVSTTSADQAYDHPEKTNYRECIIKMYCSLDGEDVWYSPAAWVTKDFSLMRGFLLGFGKKIGSIEFTNPHPLNPALQGKRTGTRLKNVCEAFNNIHFETSLTLTKPVDASAKLDFSGMPLCVTRHFPSTTDPTKLIFHDVSKLRASNYRRDNIWLAEGSVKITPNEDEPVTLLQPLEVLAARTFSEGFTLHGTKTMHIYGDDLHA